MTDGLTRVQLLRRAAAGGAFLTVPGVLAACGGTSKKAASTTANQTLAKTLRFSNWTLYIDINGKTKRHPTLDAFKKKTGTTVQYTEDINDNATYFGKIQGPLSRGQSIDRDIIVMTDNSRYPSLLIKKGWVEKLDKSAIPNIKNLEPTLQHPNWDPNRDYSLPWQSGLTGIAYNDKLTDPVLTVPDLLENPKLKGKITLLQGVGDTMPLIMAANGDDPTKVTDASWNRAFKLVKKAVDSGQIRQFTGNDYSGPLAKGDLSACFAWSGDVVQLEADNKHLHWNLPKEGGGIWTDNMLIPKGGNVYTASVYMNYYYEPKVAAAVEDYVNYICPVVGAKEVLLKQDPSIAKNTLIFPTKAMLANAHNFDANALNNEKYITAWQNLISG
ncbi:MAG: spermidine/putrescine ABC transporter substrate-binding protein [Actinobacteria bacterium]|nr:MAG: spermidine/putrescine ABC transporter substrate-binding protein [Actinomycetota bacterium]TML86535.1 MAG: spermidine/putrescine ABC transporter substrate-binding protein [Actinomycetota bacterium]